MKSRDSSVGTVTDYGLDDRMIGVRFLVGAGNFSFHHRVQTASGAHQPTIQWVSRALSLGVKRPGREANHSPPSRADVKECVELYLHSHTTSSWRGAEVKQRDNFTFKSE
jgi:hypothetical protein